MVGMGKKRSKDDNKLIDRDDVEEGAKNRQRRDEIDREDRDSESDS